MKTKLVSMTQMLVNGINTPEELIVYIARVSNPNNQLNTQTAPSLIRYLVKNKHWSPFEMVNICFEIETSRAISQQLIRHKSFSFQEFSQRYSKVENFEPIELRKQAIKDRQSSSDIINDKTLQDTVKMAIDGSFSCYNLLLEHGVAKEVARMVLPLTTKTRLYMNGSLRSWIHFLDVRDNEHAQKETQEIAREIKNSLKYHFPNVFDALSLTEKAQ